MMRRRTLSFKTIIAAAAGCFAAFFAFAARAQVDLGINYATAIGLGTTDIRTTISRIISYFLGFLGIVAVVLILYAGVLWMTAGGNTEQIDKAKRIIRNAAIGLAIILSSYAIARFFLRAAGGGQLFGEGSCAPGQVCSSGGGFGGGASGGFRLSGIVPSGSGPNQAGWPKNYGITVGFNAALKADTITDQTFQVQKCNPRVDGSGVAQPFVFASCSSRVAGTLTVEGSKALFKPSATPGDNPTDFEGDFWYYVLIRGGAVRDARNRALLCPFRPGGAAGDVSSPQVQSDLCERAIAVNNLRDVEPPTVTISVPHSPPGYCAQRVRVQASAKDDFLVSEVHFFINGGTDGLTDEGGEPLSSVVNGSTVNPFNVDTVYVDTTFLTAGTPSALTATAQDGVPQASQPASATVTINPANCCNNSQDANEDGLNCGVNSGCGACSGAACTTDADCASGFCDLTTKRCVDRPIIDEVDPASGAVGTLVTIRGRAFGSSAGRVIFLGADMDGDGDPKDASGGDDVVAQACAPTAWSSSQTVIAVPEGAKTGPLELVTAAGQSDRTDKDPGWSGPFTVNGTVRPGICTLEPDNGSSGTVFTVRGSGFGGEKDGSDVLMAGSAVDIAAGLWAKEGNSIGAVAPSMIDGTYPVKLRVGSPPGQVTNSVDFSLAAPVGEQLRISDIIPASGPPGTYVTIVGSGFGTKKGVVQFAFGSQQSKEVGTGDEPACSDNWHPNYVVVKVPKTYTKTSNATSLNVADAGVSHAVTIVTSAGRTSNAVDFKARTGVPGPGLCAITPDNGPAGKVVTVSGEGFGDRPQGSTTTSLPRYTVEFFKDTAKHCLVNTAVACTSLGDQCSSAADGTCVPNAFSGSAYGDWSPDRIPVAVPGSRTDKKTWPKTGPVYVIAGNVLSTNAVPFTVRDCNDAGGDKACTDAGAPHCCANGSCQASCEIQARASAYGWRLSTEVLPAIPVVIERAICDVAAGAMQSPSPFKDSVDACKNVLMYAEFNKKMDGTQLTNTANFTMLECGTGAAADCSANKKIAVSLLPESEGAAVSISTAADFTRNTWYRVTLLSDAASKKGLKDTQGQYLDGDYDGNQGGNYSWSFKVRDSDQACELANVIVNPAKYNVDHEDEPGSVPDPLGTARPNPGFVSKLLAENCEPLQCRVSEYTVGWQLSDDPIAALRLRPDLLVPKGPSGASGACLTHMTVIASKETPPGFPAKLTASAFATGATSGSKSGDSKVTVKFADPIVIEFEPDCDAACVNARISATFNIPMKAESFVEGGNALIFRCRNATCNPPYAPDLGEAAPGVRTVRQAQAAPPDSQGKTRRIQFIGTRLQPNTFYIVKLRGGADDAIRSSSGVPLTGLNDGQFFTWIFKTKEDGTPCAVDRATIDPPSPVLHFVGERASFEVTPFGAPDSCNAHGQALLGGDYDWGWSSAETDGPDEGVVGSFLKAASPQKTPTGTLDTNEAPVNGCSERCLNVGSQTHLPQCGNGVIERGEDCEKSQFSAGCSPTTCTFTGVTAQAGCGNGRIDPGEECDKVGGATGVFPKGCKDPDVHVEGWADSLGCVNLGAVAGGSACGDGFVADGEDCDDGNKQNGDGCSSDCLHEGTLPSCAGLDPSAGAQCVNFCGNGVTEPGEDTGCDTPSGIAPGCNRTTCLRSGSETCDSIGSSGCCGNGRLESASGEECETVDDFGVIAVGGTLPPYCSPRCLLKGSSAKYAAPSFCRDGIAGPGEDARCESGTGPDANLDPLQVILAGLLTSDRVVDLPDGTRGATTVVSATVPELTSQDRRGKADVTLNCTCREQAEPQRYCSDIGSAQDPQVALGCSNGGCCAPAPQLIEPTFPENGSHEACRNTVVRLTFDQQISQPSAKNIIVGEGVSGDSCGNVCSSDLHTSCDPRLSAGEIEQRCGKGATCVARRRIAVLDTSPPKPQGRTGFWGSVWGGVKSFFNGIFGSAASATDVPTDPPLTYCEMPGSVRASGSVVTWSPSFSFSANVWVRAFLPGGEGGIAATNGVPMAASRNVYFKTGIEICKMDRVLLLPESQLFTRAEDGGPAGTPGDINDGDQEFTARAHPANRPDNAEIASTPEYAFKWDWALSLPTSVIVVAPKSVAPENNGYCEDTEDAAKPDCSIDLVGAPTPKPPAGCGNDICEKGETAAACPVDCRVTLGQEPEALVSVRRDGQGFPKNGEDVVTVAADISERGGLDKSRLDANADIVVMLCENPWPDRRDCTSAAGVVVPWDADPTSTTRFHKCIVGQPTWVPFYDPLTQTAFYYCRDVQKKGDGGDLLPALKENPVRVAPGRDIIREYLLTFAASTSKDAWAKDAIGFRIAKNADHLSVADWYRGQGFKGSPQVTTVDGYPAINEGRTTYVSAAAKSGTSLFTNIGVFSMNDGAAPETKAVFSQVLENVTVHRNIRDRSYCVSEAGGQVCVDANGQIAPCGAGAAPVACADDRTCRVASVDVTSCVVDPQGARQCTVAFRKGDFVPGRSRFVCGDFKTKLTRDVRRIADLQSMRSTIAAKKQVGYPTLVSGSFLRGISESSWPSWAGAFGSDLGSPLPKDPVNSYLNCGYCTGSSSASPTSCAEDADCSTVGGTCTFDPSTCFSPKDVRYLCPKGSHVYEYRGTGGVDFRLSSDLEVGPTMCESFSSSAACGVQQELCVWNDQTNACTSNVNWQPTSDAAFGQTCIAKAGIACAADPACEFVNGACQYKEGKLFIGGYTGADACQDAVTGDQGRCGDGVVQSGEDCEPGMTQTRACVTGSGSSSRNGVVEQSCSADCAWNDVLRCANKQDKRCTSDADCGSDGPCAAVCSVGRCGDGLKQPTEACDDGTLNGSYGHCNAFCNGLAFSCGDGTRQPNEACDCREKNGAYAFNGILAASLSNVGTSGGTVQLDKCIDQHCGGLPQGTSCNADRQCAQLLLCTNNRCGGTPSGKICFNNDALCDPRRCTSGICGGSRQSCTTDQQCAAPLLRLLQVTTSTCGSTPTNTLSCAFDCSGPGPRCGDGIVNAAEQCDGGFQEFKGFCVGDTVRKTGCNNDNACNFGRCLSGLCANNTDLACTTDQDCLKKCGNFCPRTEQVERRVCGANNPALSSDDTPPDSGPVPGKACSWSNWTCTAPGSCGNGHVDQGEECDDGNTDNDDGCVIDAASGRLCRKNVCGDGFTDQSGSEECDDGAKNGTTCDPGYGGVCNYCTFACKVGTVSGGYCGDNIVQGTSAVPPGPEQCEGTQGITGYACISTRSEDLSRGKKVADAFCATNGCQRACGADAVVCQNTSGSDGDSDTIRDICDPDDDNDNVPAQFDCKENDREMHGEYKYTVDSPGHCTGDSAITCKNDGDCAIVGRGTCVEQNRCGRGSTTEFGPICDVPAAPETCDDKDNDCNNKTDNVYWLDGRVEDAQTNTGIGGIKVNALCSISGNSVIASATTDSNGAYRIEAVDNGDCDKTFRVYVPSDNNLASSASSGDFCAADTQQSLVEPTSPCVSTKVDLIALTKKPLPGQYRVVLTWGKPPTAPDVLDIHGRDSSLTKVLVDSTQCSLKTWNLLPNCDGTRYSCKRTKADETKVCVYLGSTGDEKEISLNDRRCPKSYHDGLQQSRTQSTGTNNIAPYDAFYPCQIPNYCVFGGEAYWSNQGTWQGNQMSLDSDDVDGEGPETITINTSLGMRYRMYVDWWALRNSCYGSGNGEAQSNCNPSLCGGSNLCRPNYIDGSFTDPAIDAVVRRWDSQCAVETYKAKNATLRASDVMEFKCSNNTAQDCQKNSQCSAPGYCKIPYRFWQVFDMPAHSAQGGVAEDRSNILFDTTPDYPRPN